MPFKCLPTLYWDGEEVGQSATIMRFVARKLGFGGGNDLGMARTEAVLDFSLELLFSKIRPRLDSKGLHPPMFSIFPTPEYYDIHWSTGEKRDGLIKTFEESQVPNYLAITTRLLRARGGKFFAGGDTLTLGDFALFLVLDQFKNDLDMKDGGMEEAQKGILARLRDDCPELEDLYHRVRNLEGVKQYLDTRPRIPIQF